MESVSVSLNGTPDYDHEPEYDLDQSVEEDVDQLASEMEGDAVERTPGESLLPSLRLASIIESEGKLALSKEGLFILSIATEEFVKRLAQGGHRQAKAESRTCVVYRDMAATTQQYQEFMFLRETIPQPVSLSDALELRELRAKEILENEPALIAPIDLPATAISTVKSRPKTRVANGTAEKSTRNSSINRPAEIRQTITRTGQENATPVSSGQSISPATGSVQVLSFVSKPASTREDAEKSISLSSVGGEPRDTRSPPASALAAVAGKTPPVSNGPTIRIPGFTSVPPRSKSPDQSKPS